MPAVRRRLTPVPQGDVVVNDAFWAPRRAVNRDRLRGRRVKLTPINVHCPGPA